MPILKLMALIGTELSVRKNLGLESICVRYDLNQHN